MQKKNLASENIFWLVKSNLSLATRLLTEKLVSSPFTPPPPPYFRWFFIAHVKGATLLVKTMLLETPVELQEEGTNWFCQTENKL